MRRGFGGWDDKKQREMKQQFLRLIIAHPELSVKCSPGALHEHKSKKVLLVTVLTVSVMESMMACSVKSIA